MSRHATGFRAWLLQRLTGTYLMLLFPWLLTHLILSPPDDAHAWRAWIAQPLISIALSLGLLSILLHAWVGLRDIVVDYVHPFGLRVVLLSFTAFGLIACGMWGTQIIFLTRIS